MAEDNSNECRVCREAIQPNASKCTHCDSFQNWRRHLNLSSNVITLLIALISVCALSAQYLKTIFITPHSEVSVAPLNATLGNVTVLAANSGNQAGAITSATLEVHDTRYGSTEYKMTAKGGDYIVRPNEVKQLSFIFSDKDIDDRHMAWIQEGIDANEWTADQEFETSATLWIRVTQYSELQRLFDQQELRRNTIIESKLRTDLDDPLEAASSDSVEFKISSYNVFPWLWTHQFRYAAGTELITTPK